MIDYSKMSDDEINLRVFEHIFGELGSDKDMVRVWNQGKYQPCKNPGDAWPIIEKNKISTCAYERANPGMKVESWWEADCFAEYITRDENPLRAAMIVFLMMEEQEVG